MSARLPCEILVTEVIEAGLCTRCGSCVGVCPLGNIIIADRTGECLPECGERCDSCGLCLKSCPGGRVDFRTLEMLVFGECSTDPYLGVTRKAWLAYAADPETRKRGASGGVATALLSGMLSEGTVSGSLVYTMDRERPYVGKGMIATTVEQIEAASQSKYHLSPMNETISGLLEGEGRYAICGLPCQVHAIRKLQAAGWKGAGSIGPVVGIYCGNNLYYEATRIMLGKLGVSSLDEVEHLSYREGEWPGEFSVTTRDGRRRSVSKLDFNQAIPFFINRRCLFCVDLTNELADISIGDGWSKEGSGEGGWSVVIARTAEGEEEIARALDSGRIKGEEIPLDELVPMHSHAFDLKKPGAWTRITSWKRLGYQVPVYDVAPVRAGRGRRLAEAVISAQFMFCGSKAGRLLFRVMPAGLMGSFFRWLRKIWMRATTDR